MAYSTDFRKRAIDFMDEGHSETELYATFKICAEMHEDGENSSLTPQYRETRRRKIYTEKLKRALERKPDATLPELALQFNCTKQVIDAALKRLEITRKKDFFLQGKGWGKSMVLCRFDVHLFRCF
jgi:hypothetical protein